MSVNDLYSQIEPLVHSLQADRNAAVREAQQSTVRKLKHVIDAHKASNDATTILNLVEVAFDVIDKLEDPGLQSQPNAKEEQ